MTARMSLESSELVTGRSFLPMNSTLTSSVTGNFSDLSAWLTRDEDLAIKEVIVQGVLFFIALIGNGAVLVVLLLRGGKFTRMLFFILNLSISDLAVALLNILPQMIWDITWRFQGNDLLCKTIKFLQVFSLYLSAWILTMMAFDRYMAICCPLNQYSWRSRRCVTMICLAWLLSALCSVPQVFVFSQKEILPGVFDCWASFIEPWGGPAYVVWFAFSIYIIPLMILCVTYGKITCTVWKVIQLKENGTLRIKEDGKAEVVKRSAGSSPRAVHRSLGTSARCSSLHPSSILTGPRGSFARSHSTYRRVYNKTKLVTVPAKCELDEYPYLPMAMLIMVMIPTNRDMLSKNHCIVKMTATVIAVYFACWTPFIFALLWTTFLPQVNIFSESVFTILLLLANLNSCTNPWIYLFFSLGKYVRCSGCKWRWIQRRPVFRYTSQNGGAASEVDALDNPHVVNYSSNGNGNQSIPHIRLVGPGSSPGSVML